MGSTQKHATISEFLSQFSLDIRCILEQLQREALVSISTLAAELEKYTSELGEQAQESEFFDLKTAKKTAELCQKLLTALPVEPDRAQHRLTQVAIRYFVLAEDAEDDNDSLIGFDDDLQVAVAVIEELGLNHLFEDGATSG